MIDEPTSEEPVLSDVSTEEPKSGIIRDEPDTSQSRKEMVQKWIKNVKSAKARWKDDFKRMDDDIAFLSGKQWGVNKIGPKFAEEDLTVINITQRHIQQRTAALYAKNPKAIARRRKTLDYAHWDGTMLQLNAIQEQIANIVNTNQQIELQNQAILQGGPTPPGAQIMQPQPIPPDVIGTLQDIKEGTDKRLMLNKVAETLEIVFNYTLNQQIPSFKSQMKQLVRRVCACGIGWVKLGYQRNMELRPEDRQTVSGITEQIARLKRLIADRIDNEFCDEAAECAELEFQLQGLLNNQNQVTREGLVFDFPLPKAVIPDPHTRHLRTLSGARWVAEEYILSNDDVKEIYGVDLKSAGVSTYIPEDNPDNDIKISLGVKEKEAVEGICVWEVWNKSSGEVFVIADGYNDFLRVPQEPDIRLKKFFPYFGLAFNELETSAPCDSSRDRISIYPISDVSLLRPMQKEYNRVRESFRRVRRANAPKIAVARNGLSEEDILNIQTADDMSTTVLTIDALQPGQKVSDVFQAIQMPPINPQIYDAESIRNDVYLVVGQSDASIGMASGGTTATGDSIAEQSRTISLASQVDDLDDMLTELARASGELLLTEMSPEKAKEIAGAGAVWPDLTAQEIADELYLEVEAGSSGRPNKAAEIANFQKIAPLLMQIPGISPEWMAKQAIMRLDDKIDPTDAIIAGLPSLLTQAQIKLQQSQIDPGAVGESPQQLAGQNGEDPRQQGPQGANNQQMPPGIAGTQGGNEAALGGMAP